MGNAEVRRDWRWTWSCDQQQNPSYNSSSRSYCFYLCLQSQVNKCAPPFTENGTAPSQIGCAERRLKIDPPLITVPLKYLSAQATFKHCSLSLGFYNPYHIPVPVMEIPKTMFWIYFTLVLSTWTYSVHIPFPDLRGWSKQVFTADLAVFFVCLFVLYSAVFNAGLYVSLQLQHFLSTFKLMLQQCIFRTFGFFAFHFLSNLFSIIVRCVQMEQ